MDITFLESSYLVSLSLYLCFWLPIVFRLSLSLYLCFWLPIVFWLSILFLPLVSFPCHPRNRNHQLFLHLNYHLSFLSFHAACFNTVGLGEGIVLLKRNDFRESISFRGGPRFFCYFRYLRFYFRFYFLMFFQI